jgi:sugar O-acyltransferase (sialic acid O-acetyltransferase NeuD family)
MNTNILIVGSGGHSKVVIEAIFFNNGNSKIRIVDEFLDKKGSGFYQKSVDYLENWNVSEKDFHVAIGSNEARSRISKNAIINGKNYLSIIHPRSIISPSATILDGSFVGANALISADTLVGMGSIINHFSNLDHDCVIGEFSHIAPNVTLLGGVRIGSHSLIGAGAVVLPKIIIGSGVIVGAGSIVTKNIPDNMTYIGNPAREVS